MSDPVVPASGPISFSVLRSVFGVVDNTNNAVKLSGDMNRDVLGNIGQPGQGQPFSISVLRSKSLPDPTVTFTPAITQVSDTFEGKDSAVTLGTAFNYQKRLVKKFTLNDSTLNVTRTIFDRGIKYEYNNQLTYNVVASGNTNVSLATISDATVRTNQSTTVPYKVKVVKRNNVEKTLKQDSVDVNDVVSARTNTFNINASQTSHQAHQTSPSYHNHQTYIEHGNSHQHSGPHRGHHSNQQALPSRHESNPHHYKRHHQDGKRTNHHAHIDLNYNHHTDFVTVQSQNSSSQSDPASFQVTTTYTGSTCSPATTSSSSGCVSKYQLSIKPQWTSTSIVSNDKSTTLNKTQNTTSGSLTHGNTPTHQHRFLQALQAWENNWVQHRGNHDEPSRHNAGVWPGYTYASYHDSYPIG